MTQLRDASSEIEARMIEGCRRMSPGEEAQCVCDLNRFAHGLATADMRRRHPQADERKCLMRAASRYLDAELMTKAVGRDPDEKGHRCARPVESAQTDRAVAQHLIGARLAPPGATRDR